LKTILPDGRVFETQPFISLKYKSEEMVYKFEFETIDRHIKSSERHLWAVWDKVNKTVDMIAMKEIKKEQHELLIQSWK